MDAAVKKKRKGSMTAEQKTKNTARKEAEKLMQRYFVLDAIIQAKRIDVETFTDFYNLLDKDKYDRIRYELKEAQNTKMKLQLVFDSLKEPQRKIWVRRYQLEQRDIDIMLDLQEEYRDMNIHYKKYYRLKKDMLNHIIEAFSLLV